jgi:hypothetical protein
VRSSPTGKEVYPDEQLFTFSIGGMRTFGELVHELLAMGAPMARGIATGEWGEYTPGTETSKAGLLRLWDEATAEIEAHWPQVTAERLRSRMTAFGQYEGEGYKLLQYVVDNEIHHRGQAYVYLRALEVEPPPFWDRPW